MKMINNQFSNFDIIEVSTDKDLIKFFKHDLIVLSSNINLLSWIEIKEGKFPFWEDRFSLIYLNHHVFAKYLLDTSSFSFEGFENFLKHDYVLFIFVRIPLQLNSFRKCKSLSFLSFVGNLSLIFKRYQICFPS